jgi:acyl-CoA synthetase (AMP-forming)/AMP-acid ligase II
VQATIGQMLATAARRFSSKPLVVTADRTLTFEELDRLSTQFARQLHTLGIQPGDRVTLWPENGWRWMVVYYGILKLGAVVNPCNIQLTADEIVFVVNDCGAKVIIAAHSKAAGIGDRIRALVITDTGSAGVSRGRSVDSFLAAASGDPKAEHRPCGTMAAAPRPSVTPQVRPATPKGRCCRIRPSR